MRVKVTKRGVVIPKDLLGGAEEVEIQKEDHRIVIALLSKPDPIFNLGKNPVDCGVPDASENHDRYLYGAGS
jgi:virulence-associated protein VagC